MIKITTFKPEMNLSLNEDEVERWIGTVLNDARNILLRGMRSSAPLSRPGQYPAIQTGTLSRNTAFTVNGLEGALGSNVEYAGYLQDGTSNIRPRALYNEALQESAEKNIETFGEDFEIIKFEK